MNVVDVRRRFTIMHYINFIAFVLQFITGINQSEDNEFHPGLQKYILYRSTMSQSEFYAFLQQNYPSWTSIYYKNEDFVFFNFFIGQVIQEILVLKGEWENPAIDLEATLTRIIAFFMKHLVCDSPKQTFLILMHILSSKCFYVPRRKITSKWRRTWRRYKIDLLSNSEKNLRIQTFFFKELTNLFISNPSLKQEILNFRENDARLFGSIFKGFKMLTEFFLTNDVPFQLQNKICVSSSNFFYRFEDNDQLWYQMIRRNFHSIQNMDKKIRVHLIKRSHILFILIWRMFYRFEKENKFTRIPLFISVKVKLSRYYFNRLFKINRFYDRFLSMEK